MRPSGRAADQKREVTRQRGVARYARPVDSASKYRDVEFVHWLFVSKRHRDHHDGGEREKGED